MNFISSTARLFHLTPHSLLFDLRVRKRLPYRLVTRPHPTRYRYLVDAQRQVSTQTTVLDEESFAAGIIPTHAMKIGLREFPPDPIPLQRIRNFCIVAHIDHGKTTLSDAILRRMDVLEGNTVGTYLDKLEVEQTRGITVKAQTCSFLVRNPMDNLVYLLNLIDTPGHADFAHELVRSVVASEGAVLLVDGTQGIEAQTIQNYHLLRDHNKAIVPAVSKIDAMKDVAEVDQVMHSMETTLHVKKGAIVLTASKELLGVEELLLAVIASIPPPQSHQTSSVDTDTGVEAYLVDAWKEGTADCTQPQKNWFIVRVFRGSIRPRQRLFVRTDSTGVNTTATTTPLLILSVGVMSPEPVVRGELSEGQVGFVCASSSAETSYISGGSFLVSSTEDTLKNRSSSLVPRISPVVFAAIYSASGDSDILNLHDSLQRMMMNDPSISLQPTCCQAFGRGFLLGFLGLLHMQVFQERLAMEFSQDIIMTPGFVNYKVRTEDGTLHNLSPTNWNSYQLKKTKVQFLEPIVKVSLVTETRYTAVVEQLMHQHKASSMVFHALDNQRAAIRAVMPFASITGTFHEQLKRLTNGYSTMDYGAEWSYEPCPSLTCVDVYVNRSMVDALSFLCEKNDSMTRARKICVALREHIEPTLLDVPITAQIGGKIIARETVQGMRKEVAAKCHAGDPTRRMKLVENQKQSRKKLASKSVGGITLTQEALYAAMKAV